MNLGALEEIRAHLQFAPAQVVIYLEGKTDVEPFFALLGRTAPRDGLHQGVFVKGLRDQGSGGLAVGARVDAAGRLSFPGVFGLIDGDGQPLTTLSPTFDHPFAGPLFTWKAYCIENLLAMTGWPSTWGAEPDWPVALTDYGPYVALNRIHVELQSTLDVLSVAKRNNPISGQPLKTSQDVLADLSHDRHRLLNYDVAQRFQNELQVYQAALQNQLDEAHAMLNGKWLFSHLAPVITGQNPDRCRSDWIAHAISAGGLAEVRSLWQRITGATP
ncbi:MAG TPA: hypothetical protein VF590_03675 [Isosphaeraceae bacterium]|jgi:hypothetical protein